MQSEPSSQASSLATPCECGHSNNWHTVRNGSACTADGCACLGFKPKPVIINDRCKCSHDRFRHNYDTADGPCSKPDCDCKAYAPVTVETVELPEPNEIPVEAYAEAVSEAVARMRAEIESGSKTHPLPPPEGPEYTSCVCGHIEPEHSVAEPQSCLECACGTYTTREEASEEAACKGCGEPWDKRHVCWSPQPERRPPLTVQYAVAGGHPYEVSIPGDASVTAEDGVLIIKHPSAQILAITRVAPMEN